jgi:phospholipid/cholesterol/gamma-HCH transport system substrate-binding protein
MNHRNQKNHFLTGVIVVTVAVGASLTKSWLSRLQVARNSYPVTIVLKDAQGLRGSETIQISGVPVGSVTQVHLDSDLRHVLVEARLSQELKLSHDSSAWVEVPLLGGSSTVHIQPGHATKPLTPGAQIQERVYE